ncbi:serine/threonine-protein kinase [Actinomycetospora chibensis]|uniref:non-specific serine/threonine protein kinase n=1 Tax=Actinomycetospora chibensis TaxID=663606 RepID=A0ABV9RRT2_9PSEU|nr:serine/threonine-protein kinase [Actinomycetospora chibensis]MDD7925154.1 serine/threonine-protein kinase [Actinomycetospora chibensis]
MADRNTQDLTGQRLGHFRVDGVIGRGGMSVLYRATDTRLGRRVALKVIDEVLAADREFRERFVDEARNTSAVDHSHVVPLYDFDETDGHLYIAMRHVEGPDLASVIDGRPLTVARTLRLLGQVADALDAVHARGLVHLDVKPANVLVTTRESAGEHVYLADFGLTRRGATGHRTSGGDFLGSPTYAAPEHLRGEPVDARTDVYSLTCVLFTCLTGRAPYLGSVTEVIDGHLGGEVPSAAELAGLDPRIDDVVRRGMDPDRPRRHESASAVIEAARGALMVPGPAPLVGPPPRRPAAGPPRRAGVPPVPPVPPVAPVAPAAPVPPVPAVGAARNGTGESSAPDAPTTGDGPPSEAAPATAPASTPRGAPSGPPIARRPPSGPLPASGRVGHPGHAGPPGPPPGPLTRASVAPPMRLRDPVPPDRDGSFARNTGAVPPRVIAGAGAAVLLVLVVLLVLLLA